VPEAKPKPNKVGRPKLPKGEAKGKTVQVRFTADDYKRLAAKAKATKQTVSEWIRSTLEANLNG
jgi:predicted HicB family RNase H-like nuclease